MDPEYLIVEPTGVGKLGNILENVRAVVYDRIELLPPVVVLCPQSFNEYVNDYPEIYRNQIENAGIVVFSKHENADPGFLSLIEAEIHKIRPDLEIQSEHYSNMDKAWFMNLLEAEEETSREIVAGEAEENPLDEVSLRGMSFDSPGALVSFLQAILMGRFGNIVRAKGIVRAGDELLRFDVADSTYAIKEEDVDSAVIQAVFIGRDLNGEALKTAGGVKSSSNIAALLSKRR